MKTRSKNNIRRIIAAVVLATVLAGAFVLTACKKQPQQDPADAQKEPGKAGENVALTEAQKSAVLTAAEAFYETGLVYDERNPLSISRIEQFVYYIYNGELTAGEDGYGSVALDEAENRIMTLFGIKKLLHTKKNADPAQKYYCEGDRYYVRVNEPAAECSIASSEWDENGNAKITVAVKGADGVGAVLEFTAHLADGKLTLNSCKRYDEK